MFNQQLSPDLQAPFKTPGLLKIMCGFTAHCSLLLTALKPQLNGHLGQDVQPRARKKTAIN
jgi:hypothetical protein